jgi:parvulin-like peptidyl-prolyl isomerase
MRHAAALLLSALVLLACDEAPPPAPPAPSAQPPATAAAPPPPAAAPSTAAPAAPEAPPESITAQHILVAYRGAKGAPKKVSRTKAEAQKRAEEALAKAKAGENFIELVKTYSDDEGTVERLGSVGRFKRDDMVKPFADAAFALKVNEISGVVESPFGFHVIKRNQ